ncbi:MAG: two-component regulator propeller domain-containing protein, partial [Bacteroidota bacterium]
MNWVSGLYQDDLGYLWIGTQYGLNRFDGKSLTSFTYHPDQPHGLRANWVKCITQDSAGKLRIGTYGGGISLYNPLDNTFSEDSIATLLEKREVHQILYMPDASIWYGCIDGLFRQKDGVLKQVLTGRRVRAMSKTSEIIWVGSDEGLHGISPVNLQTFSLETQKKVV